MQNYIFRITVTVEPDGEGFYAHSDGLPGIFACGETEEEALQEAVEGATSIIRSMLRFGDKIEENNHFKMIKSVPKENTITVVRKG